jgi:hypothetical protein
MNSHRRFAALALAAASVLALSGCATGTPGGAGATGAGLGGVWPPPPEGRVVTQGTVLEADGDVQLCLGAVAESYPPQCSGIPLHDWSWDGVEGAESASGVTWGAYALQGTFDGEAFTVVEPPIMLALYDPIKPEDPTEGKPGAGSEEQLAEVQDDLPDRLGDGYLSSYVDNGWLWVDVVWDDGTWQAAADEEYGEDVVIIRSVIRTL